MVNKAKKAKKADTDNLQGFKAIEWKIEATSPCIHHFFAKPHSVRGDDLSSGKPIGRTLFLINIPPYFSTETLEQMFSIFGPILNTYIHQAPTSSLPEAEDDFFPELKNKVTGYKVAYIVYKSKDSLEGVMEVTEPLILEKPVTGIRKWVQEYNKSLIPLEGLKKSVKVFMDNYELEALKKKEDSTADEEGWIKVTRKGKRPGTARTEKNEERLQSKKRKYEKQLLNFTPSQIKETRATQLADLKRKFDEDKQRVSMLRQQRKFKPF